MLFLALRILESPRSLKRSLSSDWVFSTQAQVSTQSGHSNLCEQDTIDMMGVVVLGIDEMQLRYEDLIRNNGLASGARGKAPWHGTRSTTATAWTGCSG